MLTDEVVVDHVQHMGCEEMDVEPIESDDDGVYIGRTFQDDSRGM